MMVKNSHASFFMRFSWVFSPHHQELFQALPHPRALRFVGGCVRNSLLNLPIDDFDMATYYRPEEISLYFEKMGGKVIPTGIAHGTITLLWKGQTYEVTTLRRDVKTDGRWSAIEYTHSWEEDAQRRDFTMNALYLDHEGRFYDPVGGEQDACQGLLRFIGDPVQRIQEDHLRILRFFRFWAWYAREVDGESLQACCQHKGLLNTLSGERITKEILRLLASASPWRVCAVLQKENFFPLIFENAVQEKNITKVGDMWKKDRAKEDVRTKNITKANSSGTPSSLEKEESSPQEVCLSRMIQWGEAWEKKCIFSLLLEGEGLKENQEKNTSNPWEKKDMVLGEEKELNVYKKIKEGLPWMRLALLSQKMPSRLILSQKEKRNLSILFDIFFDQPFLQKLNTLEEKSFLGECFLFCARNVYKLGPLSAAQQFLVQCFKQISQENFSGPGTVQWQKWENKIKTVIFLFLACPWPSFPLTGKDMLTLNIQGPQIKEALQATLTFWIEKAALSFDQGVQLDQKVFRPEISKKDQQEVKITQDHLRKKRGQKRQENPEEERKNENQEAFFFQEEGENHANPWFEKGFEKRLGKVFSEVTWPSGKECLTFAEHFFQKLNFDHSDQENGERK